jgi:hypothetical protein
MARDIERRRKQRLVAATLTLLLPLLGGSVSSAAAIVFAQQQSENRRRELLVQNTLNEFEQVVQRVSVDKRGGSRLGRIKRKNRQTCRWTSEYLDPETRVYNEVDFRNTFGVPQEIFR